MSGVEKQSLFRKGKRLFFCLSSQCRRNEHVDHHTYNVVCDGDKRSGGQSRVDLQFIESHGDQCSEDTGEHHDRKQA